ncbi:MAG: DUF3313 domain-containing protein [Syntrophorhabdaceae bacterium]
MKKILYITVLVVMTVMLALSAGYAQDAPKYSGFLAGYYDNLKPGPEGGVKMRWLKPGIDFTKYRKLMLDSVVFYLSDDSEYKGIDPQDMKELADGFNKAVMDTMNDKSIMVAEPAPEVARIKFAITGLKQSRPGLSAVSSIIPVGLAMSFVKKGVSDSWSGSGATSMEVMVLDSKTNEVIAVGVDQRTAGFTERFSKWGSAQEAFKFWSQRLKLFVADMDALRDNPVPK